ncbi:MAG: SDR family oxidoreductase [Rubricoccaceae bacterium]|nr:SDR family oxidoreductase [Rubricoccaceae bacterium]
MIRSSIRGSVGAGVAGVLSGLQPDAGRAGLVEKHPIGHLGEPDDIANAVLYLASDDARFVTGTELVVDGGYTAE